MCDVGGGLPLWDEDGRLPYEDEFLLGYLGLQAELLADLAAWADEYERGTIVDVRQWEESGKVLRSRLAESLGNEFSVRLALPRWADDRQINRDG